MVTDIHTYIRRTKNTGLRQSRSSVAVILVGSVRPPMETKIAIDGLGTTYGGNQLRCDRSLVTCIVTVTFSLDGVVIITTPASPLPIELVATTENV